MLWQDAMIGRPCCVARSTLFIAILIAVYVGFLRVEVIFAQSATATLTGSVIDENDALIVGVEVIVTNTATSLRRTVTTNNNGNFVIPFLPPARYSITARREGFTPTEVRDVELNVNDQVALRIQLKIGPVNEMVVVESGGSSITTEAAAVVTTISRPLVDRLLLNGRSFQSLATLAPGVVQTKADGTNQGQFSVNGQRADANYLTVDGVGANFGITHYGFELAGNVPATSASGSTSNLVSLDGLQEFSIQTSTYTAENGRTSGGQLSVITRSGTNQFHGTLFEYFRNEALDANDWFANSRSLGRAPLRQNNFGGVIGGPIVKKRTFFFFSYEAQRLRLPRVAITQVPSLALREQVPEQVRPFLNALPLPNGTSFRPNVAEFLATYANQLTADATSIRLDHSLSEKLNIFGRYNYAPSRTLERQSPGTAVNNLAATKFHTETLTGGATHILGNKTTNEVRLNYSKSRLHRTYFIDEFGGAVPLPDSLYPSFGSRLDSLFSFSFLSSYTVGKGSDSRQRHFNIVDNLLVSHGDHRLRFGIDYRHLSPVRIVPEYSQRISTTVALALSATASQVNISSLVGQVLPIFTNFSAYGEDSWSLTPAFTLTYGLRWELNPPPGERNGNHPLTATGGFDPDQMTLAPRGTPLWKTRYTNFAPRLGMAYALSRTPGRETVLRGGWGVYYDLGMGYAGAAPYSARFPFFARKTLRNVSFPLSQSNAQPPALTLNPPYEELVVFDPAMKTARTYQWSFGVDRSLGTNQVVSASYVAAVGRHLAVDQYFVMNETFPRLHVIRSTGTSDYHAMQLQFDRRLSRRWQALASYTWGHSIDTGSSDQSFGFSTDPDELRNDRGPSDFDVRHSVSAAITYDYGGPRTKLIGPLLRNWSIGVMTIARTATPIPSLNLLACNVDEPLSNGCARPDLIANVPVYLFNASYPGGKRLNPAAFANPTSGRQGTLGRNAIRGYPVFQVDLTFRRKFRVTEKLEVHLGAEVFNVLNHPNFADPEGSFFGDPEIDFFFGYSHTMLAQSLGTTAGGVGGLNPIYQLGGPRSVQLALKLKF